MSSALCFTSTRATVQSLFDYLGGSFSSEDFVMDFTFVQREWTAAVLEAAKDSQCADASAAWRGAIGTKDRDLSCSDRARRFWNQTCDE